MRFLLFFILALGGMQVQAHQFTPAYPRLEVSYIDDILVAKMELFNSRNDVTFYELSVFDDKWNPMPFATTDRIIEVGYLQRKNIEIYVRSKDKDKIVYICSKSKLSPVGDQITVISSRICSKVK